MPVKLGKDQTVYHLYIDLGSPLTWLEDKSVSKKKGYKDLTHNVQTQYGDDTVFRGHSSSTDLHYQTKPTETILNQFIAQGHLYDDINAADPQPTAEMRDGMLGLSPATGSKQYVYELIDQGGVPGTKKRTSDIETLMSALKDEAIIGVFFTPYGVGRQAQLTFKGVNDKKFLTGHQPVFTPVVNKSTGHWRIKQTMKYGTGKAALPGSSDVVTMIDTGYAFIDLTASGFAEYKKKTGAVEKQGYLVLNAAQYQNLESLWFTVDGHDFEITKDAQLWPRRQNKTEGFADDDYVLAIGTTGDATMMYGLAWCT